MNKIYKEINIPETMVPIVDAFNNSEAELYLVGGCVRDAILGNTPKDYDLATNVEPDMIMDIVSKIDNSTILEIGKSFGIINVVIRGDEYEIATFRKDIGEGRRPDSVEFTNIQEDVKRRDLTINALFYDISEKCIYDYVGGIDDLNNKLIRTVGDPDARFNEDPLRIMRVIRFMNKYKFTIGSETESAMMRSYGKLNEISRERIRDELIKTLSVTTSHEYLSMYLRTMFSHIFPGLYMYHNTDNINKFNGMNNVKIELKIASIIGHNDNMSTLLSELKYTSKEVKSITCLSSINRMVIDPHGFYRKFKSSQLTDTDLMLYASLFYSKDIKTIQFLYNVTQIDIKSITDDLMSKGLQGKELGDAITDNVNKSIRG
jgi:tRNA nucleotidyltransferase (CCA-adding enzyme)